MAEPAYPSLEDNKGDEPKIGFESLTDGLDLDKKTSLEEIGLVDIEKVDFNAAWSVHCVATQWKHRDIIIVACEYCDETLEIVN